MIGKVFVFLADGFEEIEGLTVVDLLRSSKMITGAHRIEVEADIMFHEVIEAEGAMYVLPGGMPGTIHLREHEGLGKVLKKAYKNNKYLAAICAAPTVLEQYGMLEGRKATSYPAMEEELKSWNGNSDRFCSQISRNHQRNKREGRITEKYCIRRIIINGQIRENQLV